MKREKELAVLFLYFVIEEMLLGGLVLPLLKEHISLEGFHAFSLLAHLFLLVIVLLICFPFAVKQADIFREKPMSVVSFIVLVPLFLKASPPC